MKVLPIIDRLPDEHLALIGEAITAWAVQEHELRLTVFVLLRLDPKRGRVAVRSTRSKDTVEMIADLMSLSGLTSKTTNLRELVNVLDKIENRRNTLAHNIWMKNDQDVLFVQSLAGVWPEKTAHGKLKRRVQPAGIPIPLESLRDLISALRQTIHQTRVLRDEIETELNARDSDAVAGEK
ncbi:MAG: hypothetical protein K0M48_02545 [Thiobacillus sp.]|nr:hypothetical protein [Thiobacillus sp.]